jgi:pSer/pThr/pTyr-binding forkhead associated (FHA) protein
MSAVYEPPWWASCPPTPSPEDASWKILEIKNGVVMQEYSLQDRPVTLFGREDPPQVHITTAHESCSRLHARIAFENRKNRVIVWLRDLGSTHGTTVNGRRLPPESIGRSEEVDPSQAPALKGSRGIILNPGDIIRFGASTRMYVFEGPTQVTASPALASPSTAEAAETEVTGDDKTPSGKDGGVNWGISIEDEGSQSEEDHDAVDLDSYLASHPLATNSHHHAAYEKIRALRYKLDNLQTECERIRRKGTEGLSAGQENQLSRNDARITEIREQIYDRERDLYEKLTQNLRTGATSSRNDRRKRKAREQNGGDEDDLDVLYDRTKRPKEDEDDEPGRGTEAATEQSLVDHLGRLRKRLPEINSASERARLRLASLKHRIEQLQQVGDLEEIFFVQNNVDLAKDALSKAETERDAIMRDVNETKKLLRIANPHWVDKESHMDEGFRGTSTSSTMPPPPPQTTVARMESRESMPPPVTQRSDEPTEPIPATDNGTCDRVTGDASTDARHGGLKESNRQSGHELPSAAKTERRSGAMGPLRPPADSNLATMSTLGVFRTSSGRSLQPAYRSKPSRPNSDFVRPAGVPGENKIQPHRNDSSDSKHDVWRAPKDQDGSGITKLNAKFAGRY